MHLIERRCIVFVAASSLLTVVSWLFVTVFTRLSDPRHIPSDDAGNQSDYTFALDLQCENATNALPWQLPFDYPNSVLVMSTILSVYNGRLTNSKTIQQTNNLNVFGAGCAPAEPPIALIEHYWVAIVAALIYMLMLARLAQRKFHWRRFMLGTLVLLAILIVWPLWDLRSIWTPNAIFALCSPYTYYTNGFNETVVSTSPMDLQRQGFVVSDPIDSPDKWNIVSTLASSCLGMTLLHDLKEHVRQLSIPLVVGPHGQQLVSTLGDLRIWIGCLLSGSITLFGVLLYYMYWTIHHRSTFQTLDDPDGPASFSYDNERIVVGENTGLHLPAEAFRFDATSAQIVQAQQQHHKRDQEQQQEQHQAQQQQGQQQRQQQGQQQPRRGEQSATIEPVLPNLRGVVLPLPPQESSLPEPFAQLNQLHNNDEPRYPSSGSVSPVSPLDPPPLVTPSSSTPITDDLLARSPRLARG